MQKLANKVAVITGGGSGIGLAAAAMFKAEGAKVIVNARNEKRLDEIRSAHGESFDLILKADVTSVAEMERFYAEVHRGWGPIDVLFLNAGTGKLMPIEEIGEDLFDEMVGVNLKGVFFGIQKALPFLSEGASIIITSSVTHSMADPRTTAYAATKAAVCSLARTVSIALKERRIRVNTLSPGPTNTPIFEKAGLSAEQIDGLKQMLAERLPVGRIGEPEELARAALFLASEDSSYMTGQDLAVDGGYSL